MNKPEKIPGINKGYDEIFAPESIDRFTRLKISDTDTFYDNLNRNKDYKSHDIVIDDESYDMMKERLATIRKELDMIDAYLDSKVGRRMYFGRGRFAVESAVDDTATEQ